MVTKSEESRQRARGPKRQTEKQAGNDDGKQGHLYHFLIRCEAAVRTQALNLYAHATSATSSKRASKSVMRFTCAFLVVIGLLSE